LRLLICEYVTGGGFAGSPLPPGLAREGDMMLGALVKDVAALEGISIAAVRDSRLASMELAGACRVIPVHADPWDVWHNTIEEVDAVWPIAPETGGALQRLSELVVRAGRVLIGSRPAAVSLTMSKRATVERLAASGVPIVPTVHGLEAARRGLPEAANGWVVKPDDGAGAEGTRRFQRADELRQALAAGSETGNLVVQPFVPGAAASMSVLCQEGRARLLSCNLQHIVIENEAFRFRGCVVGGYEQRRPLCEQLAAAVAAAIPDLWGYVGIDLVDGDTGPLVLEVNPRLTTSYVGLRQAIGANPAALVLRLLQDDLSAGEQSGTIRAHRVDVGALDAA
jgi:predicted ATP-grasp superfamily ATP-dependent carboligase